MSTAYIHSSTETRSAFDPCSPGGAHVPWANSFPKPHWISCSDLGGKQVPNCHATFEVGLLGLRKTIERWSSFPTNLIGQYSSFRGPFHILAAGREVPSANLRGTCASLFASACFTRFPSASIGVERKVILSKGNRGQNIVFRRSLYLNSIDLPVLRGHLLACKRRATLPRSFRGPSANLPRNLPAVLVFFACCWMCWQLLF